MFTSNEVMMLIAACGVCEDMLKNDGSPDSLRNAEIYKGLQEELRALSGADGISYAEFATVMKKEMQ